MIRSTTQLITGQVSTPLEVGFTHCPNFRRVSMCCRCRVAITDSHPILSTLDSSIVACIL